MAHLLRKDLLEDQSRQTYYWKEKEKKNKNINSMGFEPMTSWKLGLCSTDELQPPMMYMILQDKVMEMKLFQFYLIAAHSDRTFCE